MPRRAPKIDPELEAKLPKLTAEELEQLTLQLQTDGCLDPIIVWEREWTVLDGHNRFRICTEHGIRYEVKTISLPSKELAIEWMLKHQLGRRNLTDKYRAYVIGILYKGRKKAVGRPAEDKCGQSDHISERTEETIAEEQGVSAKTVRRDAAFADAVDTIAEREGDDAKANILNGQSGLTRQQVIEIANRKQLCTRCQRVGAVADCKACAELNEPKPPPKKKRQKPSKNGCVAFHWAPVKEHYGALVREIDNLARPHKKQESPEAEGLRRLLAEWMAGMQNWEKELRRMRA